MIGVRMTEKRSGGEPFHGRRDHKWQTLSQRLRTERDPVCHICGEFIDIDLPAQHKKSWTLDHVVPLIDSEFDPYYEPNLAPAHRDCNGRKGNEERRRAEARRLFVVSRQW
jgi:5-methylcytosine-specific restriction endonuclease McrA